MLQSVKADIAPFLLSKPSKMYVGTDTRSSLLSLQAYSVSGDMEASFSFSILPVGGLSTSWGCFSMNVCNMTSSSSCTSIYDKGNLHWFTSSSLGGCGTSNAGSYSVQDSMNLSSAGSYALVFEVNPQSGSPSDFYFNVTVQITLRYCTCSNGTYFSQGNGMFMGCLHRY